MKRRATTALIATTALFLLAAAPANAVIGWGFKETFGSANQPTFTTFNKDLAVDNTGDLLVADPDGATVTRWNPDGTPSPFSALGSNVIDGAAGGPDATPDGRFFGRIKVAVDYAGTGNIYVLSENGGVAGVIDVFSPAGGFLGRWTGCGPASFRGANDIAVDDDGNVYFTTGWGGGIGGFGMYKFDPSVAPPANSDCVANFLGDFFWGALAAGDGPSDGHVFLNRGGGSIRKLDSALSVVEYEFGSGFSTGNPMAVDPATGHLFAAKGSAVIEHDASGPTAGSVTEVARLFDAGAEVNAIVVGGSPLNLYVTHFASPTIRVYEKRDLILPDVALAPPTNIGGSKATLNGTLDPNGLEPTECRFTYQSSAGSTTVPCAETPAQIGSGTDPVPVHADLTGLVPNGTVYQYRLLARNREGVQVETGRDTFTTAETFVTSPATAVTVNSATVNGTVKLESLTISDCRFEYGTTLFYSTSVPCSPHFSTIPNDENDHPVSAALSGLEPSTVYRFRIVAETSVGQIRGRELTFVTPGAPAIVEQRPLEVEQTTATLRAKINPAGAATGYHFEWGSDTTYGNRIPATGELSAGSGTDPVTVSEEINGLSPATDYHFRVVAGNSLGPPAIGPDQLFGTLNEAGLADDRGIELVSPADKSTAGSVAPGFLAQPTARASRDGDSFLYSIQNGVPDSTAGGWTRWRAERTDGGWLSSEISPPALIETPRMGGFLVPPSRVNYITPDLNCALVETHNPLTADTPAVGVEQGVENLYRWNGADGSYDLITNRLPLNPSLDTQKFTYRDIEASDDCRRIYFRTSYEFIRGASGLYEWDDGVLRDGGELPNRSPGAGAVPGGEVDERGTARWNAVSPDGGRFFFTAVANEGPSAGRRAIFMRTGGGAEVRAISTSETAVPTGNARYETASPDSGKVFFVANYGIADTSSAGATNGNCDGSESFTSNPPIAQKPCDLYAYDTATGTLADISVDTADPQGAQVQGVVAVDRDGSHVYFAALGQLVPGVGRTYAQNTAGEGSANIYLATGGEFSYVTTLSRGDLMGGILTRRSQTWTTETSADGNRLLFQSTGNLTGYDSGGGRQAYLYDAETEKLACVSCPPDGGPTLVPSEGTLLADIRHADGERPGSLSEDGSRVFFRTPDVLAPGAVVGEAGADGFFEKANVYQWREGHVTFLATVEPSSAGGMGRYLDSSADGDTVFVATKGQLAPQDRDFVSDVYAIRIGGGFPFDVEPEPCDPLSGGACEGAASSRPDSSNPATPAIQGSGNPPVRWPKTKTTCPRGKRKVTRGGKTRCVRKQAKKKSKRAANKTRRASR